ncbi:MAG: class I SAM-dependent methyltransferase [Rhodospirillales bacterium]|nr:class I SAM-dependent methyltransferase [Alphaproteobacteria bacterium]MBL6948879.1 class I SAM-dependent methyltransferase [Rhodospirillales bacterium]
MADDDSPSDNLVFRKDADGNLEFAGEFEKLYETEADPWDQLGGDSDMAGYYTHSRGRLMATLRDLGAESVVEVGCGFGMVTEEIRGLSPVERAVGMDISPTAVKKAAAKYPDCEFLSGDIMNFERPGDWQDCDVVVINQAFWYILELFDQALDNSRSLLRDGGHLLIIQAFFRHGTQRYAKDTFNGFGGLVERVAQQGADGFEFVSGQLWRDEDAHYDDGHVMLRRI